MNDISSDDIFLLKQRLAEQEALIHALQEKLSNREREIDHLQAQLDKLRRMNFGSRSEKVSRRIAQMEADLNRLQKESDTLTGRGSKPLRIGQTRRRCAVNSSSALLAADGKCSLLERVNELRPFSSMFCDMFIAGNFRAAAMYFKNRVIRVVPKTVRLYTEHRMASF